MADNLTLNQINHIFSDVRRVIRDAFKVPRHRKQMHGRIHQSRRLSHDVLQRIKNVVVQIIHNVIIGANLPSRIGVEFDERVNRLVQQIERGVRHLLHARWNRWLGIVREPCSSFGDIHGEITNAFQLTGNLQNRGHSTKIDRDRLMKCENFEAVFLYLDIVAIDLVVTKLNLPQRVRVPREQTIDGSVERILQRVRTSKGSFDAVGSCLVESEWSRPVPNGCLNSQPYQFVYS